MNEKIIESKRGLYGRVNITLSLPVKISLMDLQIKLGMKKTEFLRLTLMTGYLILLQGIEKKNQSQVLGCELSQQPART